MEGKSIELFMRLAGQNLPGSFVVPDEGVRKLGAQLLLTELLEYIIHGLGVTPTINGTRVTKSEDVSFEVSDEVDLTESLDGLADIAYTMYWNAIALGAPLEEAFTLVCENNLQKFVKLDRANFSPGPLVNELWGCGEGITWPAEVMTVTAILIGEELFAVGKDGRGKVRKPSSYKAVDLSRLVSTYR